jgi:hypothetical protein
LGQQAEIMAIRRFVREPGLSDGQINKLAKLKKKKILGTIESGEAQNIITSNILEVGNYFYLLCFYTNLSFSSLIGKEYCCKKASEDIDLR